MFCDNAISLLALGKCYQIYENPRDRLLQMLFRHRRQYYREFWALRDVTFDVARGESIGIVGRNGAGKSTLLQLICGTLSPTTGGVTVSGRVAALLELGAGFNPEFTGRENIYLSATVMGLSRQEIDACYDDIVHFSGIRDFIDQPVKTYSSGMYIRLAFAVATSVNPDILIIDEALSVGDGAFARKSFDRIMALKERGATILFCSHSMYHIEAICNRALWLDAGRVMMVGEPARVVTAFSTALMTGDAIPDKEKTEPDGAAAVVTGSGQARIDKILATADGVAAQRLSLRSGESDLLVQVFFSSDPELSAPSVAFGLETHAGVSVSSAGTLSDGVILQRAPDGSGVAELYFPKIPLMRGSYRMSIYLACERMLHMYDYATYCIELDVTHKGIEQGVVFLPRQWRSTPPENINVSA